MPALMQVALKADDLTRSTPFYNELLGREPVATFDPPGLAFYDLDGIRLLLGPSPAPSLIYVKVDSLEAALARLDGRATLAAPPQRIFSHADPTLGPAGTEEWHATIIDPDGNTVGLIELRPAAGG